LDSPSLLPDRAPASTRARVPRQVVRGPGLLRPVDVAAFSEGGRAFGLRQVLGNNRERCVHDFLPYPGFVRDTYKKYSEPWFGGHQVLRAGGWAREASCLAAPGTSSIRPLYARPARYVRRVQGMCYLASTQLVAACPLVGGTTRLHDGSLLLLGARVGRAVGRDDLVEEVPLYAYHGVAHVLKAAEVETIAEGVDWSLDPRFDQ
jgi:hypothetical protein